MPIDESLYCKIFVNASLDRQHLIEKIGNSVSGNVQNTRVTNAATEIDIRTNQDYDPEAAREKPDGFVFFRYYLDVDQAPGANRPQFVRGISELLEALWACGIEAIAACDFENELPKKGGYNTNRQ